MANRGGQATDGLVWNACNRMPMTGQRHAANVVTTVNAEPAEPAERALGHAAPKSQRFMGQRVARRRDAAASRGEKRQERKRTDLHARLCSCRFFPRELSAGLAGRRATLSVSQCSAGFAGSAFPTSSAAAIAPQTPCIHWCR